MRLPQVTRSAVLAVTALAPVCAAAEGQLNILTWTDYHSEEVIADFEAASGVDVTFDYYDSNEALLARLKAGVTGYDIVVPSDYMVRILIDEGLLLRSELNQLPNFANVDPRWVEVYWDPGRAYSVPYVWGTTALAVDTAAYSGPAESYSLLFEPPPELSGKINMLNDMTEVIHSALRYLDLPRCNGNPEDLTRVNDLLAAAKPHWLSINTDAPKELLVSGDVAVSQIWNGYAQRARLEKPTIRYVFPKEGLTGWMDNLAILNDAPNVENAKLFIDFMLEPKNAARNSNDIGYASGVLGGEAWLTEEFLSSPELQVPAEAAQPEWVPPCPPDVVALYERIWTNLLR
jgi:spermidine/putrescine transport system substrate-binding protein